MKLHYVGWLCVICRQAVITLSGLYCTVHSEMKREERGEEAECGWSQRTNGVIEGEKYCVSGCCLQQPRWKWCVSVNFVSSLLFKYGYQHENSNIQRAQINRHKLEVIGEENKEH